jgi:hypothetical protein
MKRFLKKIFTLGLGFLFLANLAGSPLIQAQGSVGGGTGAGGSVGGPRQLWKLADATTLIPSVVTFVLGTVSNPIANGYFTLLTVGTLTVDIALGIPFTQGSVLFVDGANNIAQDNANLFWDDTNNRLGIGTSTPGATLEVNGTQACTPSATQNITAGGGVTVTDCIMRVQGSGGAVTITATPNIADGTDGEIVTIQGDNDTNTLTIQDESNLTGSGVQMRGGLDCVLGKGDIIELTYDLGDDFWYATSECLDN